MSHLQKPGPSSQKKLLPDGVPPLQPPAPKNGPPTIPGQRQILRVNQACKTCRRQKMRCEGPDNPPCSRCKLAGTECVFEKVIKTEADTPTSVDRIRDVEDKIESMRQTQEEMHGTLQEVLSLLREIPKASSAFPPPPPPTRQIDPSAHLPDRTYSAPLLSTKASTSSLPPLQSVVGMDSYHTGPAYTPDSRSSSFASDPSSSRLAVVGDSPMSAIDHKSPSLLEPRPSLRRPASSTPPFNSPGQGSSDGPTLPKRRRRNDIKSLLDDDTGTVWASSSQGQAGGEVTTVEPTFVNVIDKGLIEEGEARSLWKIYFDGCQPVLPVFDPRTDTFDSFKTRSPLCFCSILTVGAKVRDGPNPPSVLQEALHQEAITMSKESIFSGIDGLEKVQAMLILAAWSRTSGGAGWLAAGHAIRLAVELGMHRSVPRLAKRMLEKRPVDPDIDNVLIAAARVWCSIYVFEIQICLGTGRPPMIGGHRTVRGVRDAFLGNPLSIASDIRLVESCEIYNILSAYLDKLTLLEEKNQMDQAGDELAEVMRQVDKWYKEWDDVMRDHDELKGSYRASLQAQRGFAHLTVNAALMRNLHTTSDIENVSPEMKKIILRATAAAQECIEICAASPPYREMIRCAITHVFSSYGFAGVFLIRMCSLFPKELDIDHVTSLIRLLLDVLDRYPAGIFIHRLHAFLNNLPASPSAQIPPITPSTFSAVPPYLPYDYPPSFTPPAAEIHFSHHHSALSGEMQQHHPRQPHIHAAPPGAVDLYSPQHGAPHNTISYPAWTTTDLQMTGDVNHVPDFLNVCSKGRE